MNKKKFIAFLIIYPILHLIFWPTYEVDKGFYEIEKQVDENVIFVRFTSTSRETESRILNRVYGESPYVLQVAIRSPKNLYSRASFESIILKDRNTNVEVEIVSNTPFKPFSNRSGPRDGSAILAEQIRMKYNNHVVRVIIQACKGTKCEIIKIEEPLKYRVKRKFYSNTFANMMGI